MTKIDVNQPCKIIEIKLKRYSTHYEIPAEDCVVIPLKKYGDQYSCDVAWKNSEGELQIKNSLMFDVANLEVIDAFKNYKLHETWEKFLSAEFSSAASKLENNNV